MIEEKKVPKRILVSLLSSLSAGVVPRIGAPYIAIGRTKEVQTITSNLDMVKEGSSFTKFIIGNYGSGKSFLISLIRGYAQEKNFVCVDCDLSPERKLSSTQGGGLFTYRELIKNMSTKTNESNALNQIIIKWISDLQTDAIQNGYEKGTNDFDEYVNKQIFVVLHKIESGIGSFDLSYVISKYYKAYVSGNEELQSLCLKWLRGEYKNKTEAKNELSVNGIIDDNNWYDYIKLYANFVKEIGYSGLVVCIDECVNLYKISNRVSRESNYEKILSIYNDTMQGKASYLGVIFAGTPQFLEDGRRGLFSYEALKSRLIDTSVPFGRDIVSPLNPLIRLKRLSDDELLALVMRTTVLYKQAYGDIEINDDEMKLFLYSVLDKAGADLITPREIIRSYLIFLSEISQGKKASELLKQVGFVKIEKKNTDFDIDSIEI